MPHLPYGAVFQIQLARHPAWVAFADSAANPSCLSECKTRLCLLTSIHAFADFTVEVWVFHREKLLRRLFTAASSSLP